MSYIIFFALALFVTAMILLIGGIVGTSLVKLYYTLDNTIIKRKLSVYGYRCYFLDNNSMKNDANCIRILPIVSELYTKNSRFNPYFHRLSEERLPLNVMFNWARSVAEDLFVSPIPSAKLDQWNYYWKSKLYTRMTILHSDFPQYEEHEMGCLWGVVYLWLAVCFEKDINDPLMKRIVQIGCKEKTAIPYFKHLYNAARNYKGEDYFLPSIQNMNGVDVTEDFLFNSQTCTCISPEDIYNGFEPLSVNERCNARKVLNDLLSDCNAWRLMRNEMKQRGWFKETIYPFAENKFVIKGDYVLEKKVEHEVANVESGGVGVNKECHK